MWNESTERNYTIYRDRDIDCSTEPPGDSYIESLLKTIPVISLQSHTPICFAIISEANFTKQKRSSIIYVPLNSSQSQVWNTKTPYNFKLRTTRLQRRSSIRSPRRVTPPFYKGCDIPRGHTQCRVLSTINRQREREKKDNCVGLFRGVNQPQ